MTRRGESKRNPVMLSVAKHLEARADRPFAAAQGDTVRQLRLMRIGRPEGRPIRAARIFLGMSEDLRWEALV
jgi:hypothetical protein